MATYGYGDQPSTEDFTSFSFYFGSGAGIFNEIGVKITMPESGTINTLNAYFAGDGASTRAALVLWDGAGDVLRQSATFTAAAGTRSVGGQDWHTKPITPYNASKNEVLWVGWWRHPSDSHVWSHHHSASAWTRRYDDTGSTSVTALLATDETGAVGAYVTYIPSAPVYVRKNGAWVLCSVHDREAGAMSQAQVKVRKAGVWWP